MKCRGVFLAGTDTDVGKTHVGCIIARSLVLAGHKVGAYKPVASGFPSWEGSDGQRLWDATSQRGTPELVSPQRFREPFAPSVAAAMEGRCVDESRIWNGLKLMASECDLLMIEGAGGLLSPIAPSLTNADLAAAVGVPAIVVANWKLGVVHQVLAALTSATAFNVTVVAIVLNSAEALEPHPSHQALLSEFLGNRLPVHSGTGQISDGFDRRLLKPLPNSWKSIPVFTLKHNQAEFEQEIDWASMFAPIK